MIVAGCAVIFFSLLAFWKYSAPLFMFTAGISIMTGFYWRDTYTNNMGLTVGIILIAYSFVCLIFALVCLFKRRHIREEE